MIFVLREGAEEGPFSEEELTSAVRAGTYALEDLAWSEGSPSWIPIGDFPGVAALFAPSGAATAASASPPAPTAEGLDLARLDRKTPPPPLFPATPPSLPPPVPMPAFTPAPTEPPKERLHPSSRLLARALFGLAILGTVGLMCYLGWTARDPSRDLSAGSKPDAAPAAVAAASPPPAAATSARPASQPPIAPANPYAAGNLPGPAPTGANPEAGLFNPSRQPSQGAADPAPPSSSIATTHSPPHDAAAPESPFAAVAEITNRATKYLAIVEGNVTAGSASVIKFQGTPLIVTNAHVLSGNGVVKFKLLNSQNLVATDLATPYDRDILVAQQTHFSDGLEASAAVDKEVSIGDEVVVLGNSEGTSVVTQITGRVTGIGPELIEVDAKFVHGNSGSPIIHVKTGKVIGIATFVLTRKLDAIAQDSQFNSIRRFGYRIDTIAGWYIIQPERFLKEGQDIAAIKSGNDDLVRLATEIKKTKMVTHSHFAPQTWVRKSLDQLATAAEQSTQFAQDRAFRRALDSFHAAMSINITESELKDYAPYHRGILAEEVKTRAMLTEFFDHLDWGTLRYQD